MNFFNLVFPLISSLLINTTPVSNNKIEKEEYDDELSQEECIEIFEVNENYSLSDIQGIVLALRDSLEELELNLEKLRQDNSEYKNAIVSIESEADILGEYFVYLEVYSQCVSSRIEKNIFNLGNAIHTLERDTRQLDYENWKDRLPSIILNTESIRYHFDIVEDEINNLHSGINESLS